MPGKAITRFRAVFLIISEWYYKQLKFSDVKMILEDITENDLRIDPVQEMKLHHLVVNLNAECQADNESYLWIYVGSLQ